MLIKMLANSNQMTAHIVGILWNKSFDWGLPEEEIEH